MTKTKPPCSSTHEPTDFAHFEAITENRRPWGDAMPGLILGECSECKTSISYPEDSSATIDRPEMAARIERLERGYEDLRRPNCFEGRPRVSPDAADLIDVFQRRALAHAPQDLSSAKLQLWADIPPDLQDRLAAWISDRTYPGPVVSAVLGRDLITLTYVSPGALSVEEEVAIVRWLELAAPSECWGSHEAVVSWLAGKPTAEVA